ncbi:hypothetical protein [Metabacillus indicus]|uniref:Uncharacterized protein n=1 Tax=Metabacillus indicus TaxID=246786 RepID=A0A084GWG9_METID|nr:hypothetical protein [Metabacillus indicus]KEZ51681.1 hypothetical protein GS18_0211185 [Metabacillus indicus]
MGFFILVVLFVGILAVMGIVGDNKKRSRHRDSSGYTYTSSDNGRDCHSDSGFFGGGDSGGGDCGGGGGGD